MWGGGEAVVSGSPRPGGLKGLRLADRLAPSWAAKYYRTGSSSKAWIFSAPTRNKDGSPGFLDLFRVTSVPIRRHVKVRAEATVYDPAYDDYFRQRREKQRRARAKVFAPARTKP